MTETIAPMEMQDNLLDVYMINPDYYFKVTGYVGELFHSVRAWWELSGMKQDEMEGRNKVSLWFKWHRNLLRSYFEICINRIND